jgi:excisionase family DNA binding protein
MSLAETVSMTPNEPDALVAKETSRLLAASLGRDQFVRLKMLSGTSRPTIQLPAAAVRLLVRILDEMARGNAVTVVPIRGEVTTQEAADILNMSRPSLIQLLNNGKIEFRHVGTHRRVRLDALLRYKRQADAARRAALAELAAYDQELGI